MLYLWKVHSTFVTTQGILNCNAHNDNDYGSLITFFWHRHGSFLDYLGYPSSIVLQIWVYVLQGLFIWYYHTFPQVLQEPCLFFFIWDEIQILARNSGFSWEKVGFDLVYQLLFSVKTIDIYLVRCSGLIIGVSDVDPIRWPNSKWKCLLVSSLVASAF